MLLFASASFGSDGQHTGVGGNPFIPPPNPSGSAVNPWSIQMLINPGLLIVAPEFNSQDAAEQEEASREEQDQKDKAGRSSAQ
ncbi:hypothetical protein [Oligoflexus tunisiensis]|uniref:hypothetical protein n=1 Tax=Oligoflexus tunisiensis TaxID=708132 RepID=UPI001C407F40|nr:hypothetical protein [Oligoflexus tunisiensis]